MLFNTSGAGLGFVPRVFVRYAFFTCTIMAGRESTTVHLTTNLTIHVHDLHTPAECLELPTSCLSNGHGVSQHQCARQIGMKKGGHF